MPGRIKAGKERAEICKLLIWLVRYVCVEYMRDEKFGASSGDVVLCCAIFVGQVERRPMTAGKLADYIGMPRPTVVRRLEALEKRHLVEVVGGKAHLTIDSVNDDGLMATVPGLIQRIHRASVLLSKMDSNPIA